MVLVLVILAAVLVPKWLAREDKAEKDASLAGLRTQSRERLARISKANMMYGRQYTCTLPPSLDCLVRNGDVLSDDLRSPGEPGQQYVLVPAVPGYAQSEAVALYDPADYDGLKPALLVNGQVVDLTADELRRRLASRRGPTGSVWPAPTPIAMSTPRAFPTPRPSPAPVRNPARTLTRDGFTVRQDGAMTNITFPPELGLANATIHSTTMPPLDYGDVTKLITHAKAVSRLVKAMKAYGKSRPDTLPASLDDVAAAAGVPMASLSPDDGRCIVVPVIATGRQSDSHILMYYSPACVGDMTWIVHCGAARSEAYRPFLATESSLSEQLKAEAQKRQQAAVEKPRQPGI